MVAAVFAIALSLPLSAQQDALLAPLPVRDQFLLGNGFFFFAPEPAKVLAVDENLVTVGLTDSNTFAKSEWVSRSLRGQSGRISAPDELANPRFRSVAPTFLVDGEVRRLDVSMRRGFGHNFELGVTIPVSTLGGGWSDELIEVTHHGLGLGNDQRELLDRNLETVYLQSGMLQPAGGVHLGDIALTGKYEFALFSLSAAIEVPTGDAHSLAGSGSVDAGLQLIGSRDFAEMRVDASLGMLGLGRNRLLGTPAQVLITDSVAISRLINKRTAVTVQLTVSESPFRRLGIAEFDRRCNQLSAGVRRQIGPVVVYMAFIENLLNYENSADAGLAWGVARKF